MVVELKRKETESGTFFTVVPSTLTTFEWLVVLDVADKVVYDAVPVSPAPFWVAQGKTLPADVGVVLFQQGSGCTPLQLSARRAFQQLTHAQVKQLPGFPVPILTELARFAPRGPRPP